MMNINMGIKLLLLLCFQKVQGQLIPQEAPELGADLFKLIESFYPRCFADKRTVLFMSSKTLYIKVPDSVNSKSVILLNTSYKELKKQIEPNIAFIQNVDIYIFYLDTFNSVPFLVNLVKKNVHGWNVNAHFFVILSDHTCGHFDRYNFLELIRVVRIHDIFMYLICGKLISTFNLYADWAPAIWNSYKKFFLIIDPGFYYFYFTKDADNYKCSDILYNQLEKLNTSLGMGSVLEIADSDNCDLIASPKKSAILNYSIKIIVLLSKILKVPLDNKWECENEESYTDAFGRGKGSAIEGIANGRFNVWLNPQPLRNTDNTLVSAIIGKMSIVIIMHHRKTPPMFQRIVQYVGLENFIAFLILGIISAFVLKYCLKASFMWSIMQSTALLVIGTSHIRSGRNSMRIFIFSVSLLGLTLRMTFSKPIWSIILGSKYDDVQTVKEFEAIAPQYKFYCPPGMDIYVSEYLKQFCFPIMEHGCEIILNDPEAACLYYKRLSYEMIVKNDLHMVPERLTHAFMGYKITRGWRLHEQFNRACTRIFQSHISPVLVNQYIYRFHRELETLRVKSLDRIKTLKLKDLIFEFQVLYIGLALALISFLCEIKIWDIVADFFHKL